jgi:hypothetical protein
LLNTQRGEPLKKKLTMLVALLAMLLIASTPLVLAQQVPSPSEVPADPGVPAGSGVAPALITPTPGSAVGCQILYGYPTAFCQVNADGLITLPDDSTAPVVVQPDGASFIVDDETGILIPIGTSAPPSEDPADAIQYDNAQGQS